MKIKLLIAALTIIVIITGVALAVWWATQPSSGTVIQGPDGSTVTENHQKPTPIDTAYFTATLPAGFEIKTNQENASSNELIQIVATQRNSNGKQIAITVAKLPPDGLPGVASYNLRTKEISTYKPIEFGGMRADAQLFYSFNDPNYEITAFIVRSSLYASISSSGLSSDKAAIDQALLSVLDSWQWR